MTRINLLPWREALRKERQIQFYAATGVSLLATLGIIGVIHVFYAGKIDYQQARNNFLQSEIKVLDKKIKQIRDLEKEKANLLARMNIIQQLQSRRPEVVHVFDDLVTTLPDGVYLDRILNKGVSITIEGIAQSNARVSSYMRNIEAAGWLTLPKLDIIQAQEKDARRTSKFKLNASQKGRKNQATEGDDKGKG